MGWGSSEERLSSTSSELRGVDMFVYTLPSGVLGRFIGRALRFRVDRFNFSTGPSADGNDKRRSLKSVEVEANSLSPLCEVDKFQFERLPLTVSEVVRLERRTRDYVLDVTRYPRILYTVEEETPTEVKGTLELRGERKAITCTKSVEGPELIVRCPIDTREFNIPSYSLMYGVFGVSPHVQVETRIPLRAVQLQG
ncbi:hypothetical protein, conserved [Trypanosoma brucei gambiense DAL972]|uniref:Lipid/polyisoprenoid-binding YceI-like domain-containing protein n=2 Tax=Trypanosoma brucei TaxID=5691 RepID=C9ZVB6_TRYB9|nr:hypothetical protein, conserved [Trypanosoma brucei gambiense DAL972]RHW70746.1 YceI-like domain containing protein [Trypanosoma brucei equiperdum]CBH13354.1 hypothetical protein, conserved [Trypanosoma brucei gambiense DAL972]|eukprot:XP_011775631.1 hypothetical protein, conserved [Trypanosoma brucei gambiense DAL972]